MFTMYTHINNIDLMPEQKTRAGYHNNIIIQACNYKYEKQIVL